MRQSGNALFLILIAVALFAALSYAITRGGRGDSGSVDKEQKQIIYAQLMQAGAMVSQAITRMKLINGCRDNQFNFAVTGLSQIPANTNAPADGSCNVFGPNGGGLSPPSPVPAGITSVANSDGSSYLPWPKDSWNVGSLVVPGLGTPSAELVMSVGVISYKACNDLNTKFGVSTNPANTPWATSGYWPAGFSGTYDDAATITTMGTNVTGKTDFCLYATNGDDTWGYTYVHVLLER